MKKIWMVVGLIVVAVVAGTSVQAAGQWVQRAGDVRSSAQFQADCNAGVAADSCRGVPTPPGCGAGKHWTTLGSGIAHCVLDDYACPAGSDLAHDSLGNPSCVATPPPPTGTCPNGATNYPTCNNQMPPEPPQPPAPVCSTYTQNSYQCSGWYYYTRSMCKQDGVVVSDTLLSKEKIGSCSCSNGMVKYPCHMF